jgi:hypothetical protein
MEAGLTQKFKEVETQLSLTGVRAKTQIKKMNLEKAAKGHVNSRLLKFT